MLTPPTHRNEYIWLNSEGNYDTSSTASEDEHKYTEITYEQFKQHILKIDKTMSYKVTRQQLKEIYDIACGEWKPKIKEITSKYLGEFDTEGTLPEDVVSKMRLAATTDQKPVIDRIFPKPVDKNAFVREFDINALDDISRELFGDEGVLQISYVTKLPGLVGRSFYVSSNYEVFLHPIDKYTVIEIKKK